MKLSNKIINDPVHGFIRVKYNSALRCINHPYFQRLRNIAQLGLTHVVYPGAVHSRFHHALGAFHLMQVAIEQLRVKGVEISDKEEEVVFNLSHKDKISTIHFDEIDEGNEKQFPTHLRTKMTTKTLNTILIENNIVGAGEIDLLCIDVENHDFEVISSIDLNKYQPYLVVIEILNLDINNPTANKTYNLLYQNGYKLKHFVFSNGFFIREQA